MQQPRGWYSRGYLPHIDAGQVAQFITWRLADSVPLNCIEQWRRELDRLEQSEASKRLLQQIERYCDEGHGSCCLTGNASRIVQECLFWDNGRRYSLSAWAVMPNHVHVVLTPSATADLESIMRPLKSVSATRINKAAGRTGRLWEPDFFDRMIRDPDHMERVCRYIEWNPVKAGLCTDPKLFPFSSANPAAWKRLEFVASSRPAD